MYQGIILKQVFTRLHSLVLHRRNPRVFSPLNCIEFSLTERKSVGSDDGGPYILPPVVFYLD